jgi:hypothetical protein
MLRVTVELIPHGNLDKVETLGVAVITNDGSGDLAVGNYKYIVTDNFLLDKAIGSIVGHNRQEGFWKLVYLVLKEIFGEK